MTERDSVTLRSATDFSVSQLSQRSATTISEISQQYSQPINHRAIEIVAPPPLARPLGTPGTAINSATSFDGAAVNREVSCYISFRIIKLVTRKSHPPNWYQVFSIIFNQLIEGRVTSWVLRCLMEVNLIHMLIYTRWWVGTVWFKEDTHISPIVTLRVRLKMTKINSQVNNSYPFWPMNPYKNLKNYIIKFILKYIIKILNSMIMSVIIWFCNFCSIFEIV